MTLPEIHQLHPRHSLDPLGDDDILALYASRDRAAPVVRANFVASIDGASTVGGRSGPLGGPADKRVFDLLRQLSDVIVVGAGTLRSERYDAMRLSIAASRWRVDNGLTAQPDFAIVSATLDLDPSSDVFADAPVRPLVLTAESADPGRRHRLARVADVISCGDVRAEPKRLVDALTARGLTQVHCEGGPHLLGTLIADDVLDQLCLTSSPLLEGGLGPRIASGGSDAAGRAMSLDHVLMSESVLFTKYSRIREEPHDDAAPSH
jgi:riboflavin biosynthesis pyrimidine reductase